MKLFLVGFMGCGKTTVGREAALALDVPFIDLDEAFETLAAQSVRAAFEERGEAWFREREAELLRGVTAIPSAVVALGGGTFVFPDNREFVRRQGISVFLDVPFEVLAERLSGKSDRPLFRSVEQAHQLWEARRPCYMMADRTVSLTGRESVSAAAAQIVAAVGPVARNVGESA